MRGEARYLLDTNICIYILDNPTAESRRRLNACDQGSLVTSAIVYAEVMVGAALRNTMVPAIALFAHVTPQPFGKAAGDAYAALSFQRGRLDRLIAAHAIALDLTLVTNNERDFADIPGLRVENWTL